MIPFRTRRLVPALSLSAICACAPPLATFAAEHQPIEAGIQFPLENGTVRVRVASPDALRVTFFAGEVVPDENPFVDPLAVKSAPEWKLVQSGSVIGIGTEKAILQVEPGASSWVLSKANGGTIASGVVTFAEGAVTMVLGGKGVLKSYGAGDSGAMRESSGFQNIKPRVSNGSFTQPFMWDPAGYGMLVLGTAHEDVTKLPVFDARTRAWTIAGTMADVYVYPATDKKESLRRFAELTGRSPVPPRWSLGFQASRWGWEDQAYIESVIKEFRDGKYPVDSFIYDFEWYSKKPDYVIPPPGEANFKDFGYNPVLFPRPAEQIAAYLQQGIRTIMIRKPRLGDKDNIDMAREKGWLVDAGPNPVKSYYPRNIAFEKPEVRTWYAEQTAPLIKDGIHAWWNDEGERDFSCYLYWNMAQQQALDIAGSTDRLFTLNRAAAPGLQRFGGSVWTGDVSPEWRHVQMSLRKKLLWSLAGQLYHTDDIGGFHSNPTPEMLIRWYQMGAYFPIMRAHSERGKTPRWPWLYGEEAKAPLRAALERRYQMLPYIYSLAHLAYETGAPIMRPLVLDYPEMPEADGIMDQWMFGPGILVAPIVSESNTRNIILPAGKWYKYNTSETVEGTFTLDVPLDHTPVYVKPGTILPLAPVIQHTGELPGGPLEVQIYPGADATFSLVEDDGETRDYQKGEVRKTTFQWNDAARTLTWNVEGNFTDAKCFKQLTPKVFSGATPVAGKTTEIGQSGTLTL